MRLELLGVVDATITRGKVAEEADDSPMIAVESSIGVLTGVRGGDSSCCRWTFSPGIGPSSLSKESVGCSDGSAMATRSLTTEMGVRKQRNKEKIYIKRTVRLYR